MALLQYPNQNRVENNKGGMQDVQNARIRYMVKNGSQQHINPPTIMAKVFAALVSIRNLLTCALIFRFPIRLEIIFGLLPRSSSNTL